jgi:hypothetical protein
VHAAKDEGVEAFFIDVTPAAAAVGSDEEEEEEEGSEDERDEEDDDLDAAIRELRGGGAKRMSRGGASDEEDEEDAEEMRELQAEMAKSKAKAKKGKKGKKAEASDDESEEEEEGDEEVLRTPHRYRRTEPRVHERQYHLLRGAHAYRWSGRLLSCTMHHVAGHCIMRQ